MKPTTPLRCKFSVLATISCRGFVFFSLFAGVCARLTVGAESPLTLDDVIARNTEAMGGRDRIESVQTVEVTLHIKDPDFEVDGVYHAARPGRMRIVAETQAKKNDCVIVATEAYKRLRAQGVWAEVVSFKIKCPDGKLGLTPGV
jgi:hypothetical protein